MNTSFFFTNIFQLGGSEFAENLIENGQIIPKNYYDDMRKEGQYVYNFSIPSLNMEGDVLPVYFSYVIGDEELLNKECENLKVPELKKGFKNRFFLFLSGQMNQPIDFESYATCFASTVSLSIGDMQYDSLDFYLHYAPPHNQPGLLTFLDISAIPVGPAVLELEKLEFSPRDRQTIKRKIRLPFVRE